MSENIDAASRFTSQIDHASDGASANEIRSGKDDALPEMERSQGCDISAHKKGAVTDVDSTAVTSDSLDRRLTQVIERKEYVHWESPEEREKNRAAIENYDAKKRAIDKAALMTQKDTLTRYRDCFDQNAVNRMSTELGSNKAELYNEPYFTAEKARDTGAYRVTGMRDVQDGKICIRDCENMDTLVHTSSHETMHDLSYQNSDQLISHVRIADGETITISKEANYSGIFRVETTRNIYSDGAEVRSRTEANRYLNEGMTELYTIEAMQARGECPRFDSYTQEVAWAIQLREKVGEGAFSRAYFGGDVAQLETRVNSMSAIDNAWVVLNEKINAYHQSVTWYQPRGDLQLKRDIDDLISNLTGNWEHGSRRIK